MAVDETDDEERGTDDGTAGAEPASPAERIRRGMVRARVAATAARAESRRRMERIEAQREDRPSVDAALSVRDEDARVAGRELAAAVAYRLFFLVLPMFLVVIGGLGLTDASGEGTTDAVREAGVTVALARDIARSTAELSFFEHLLVIGTGAWGTYLAGRGLLKTLTRVHANAWNLPLEKLARPAKTIAVAVGVLIGVVLVSGMWNRTRADLGVGEFLLVLPAVAALYGGLVVVLQAQLPRPPRVPWTALVPGGILFGVGLSAMQAVLLGYVARRLSSSSELYGGIATAIVSLFWLYLLGRMLVLAPVLDAVVWRRQRHDDT